MLDTLYKSSQALLDLFYPPRCIHCNKPEGWLCQACLQNIPFISPPICEQCGTPLDLSFPCQECAHHPLQHIDGVRVGAFFEDNPIREAIHALKYRDQKVLALVLSEILSDTYRRYHLTVDVVVPVPLHRSRIKTRGYNQSELLARHLAMRLDLPVNMVTLRRTRKTESQMSLGADERQRNVADAFACCDKQLENRRILLIDDVCTTGSTLDACASALKASGAASVWGLTLAKAR